MLEINNMRTGFWFVALSPFVSAVVALATAAAMSRRFDRAATGGGEANSRFRTLLVFLSFIEVLATTILEGKHRNKQAKRIDRFCRVIFPLIFVITGIAIFGHPRS